MTPREIELRTIAKLEHDGHQLEAVELRELKRQLEEGRHYQAATRNDDRPRIPLEQISAASCEVMGTKPAPHNSCAGGSSLTFSMNSGF